jgi:hypothetical protein
MGYPSVMDVNRMLSELRREREKIDEAIIILERLGVGSRKRRGVHRPATRKREKHASDSESSESIELKQRGRAAAKKGTQEENKS